MLVLFNKHGYYLILSQNSIDTMSSGRSTPTNQMGLPLNQKEYDTKRIELEHARNRDYNEMLIKVEQNKLLKKTFKWILYLF